MTSVRPPAAKALALTALATMTVATLTACGDKSSTPTRSGSDPNSATGIFQAFAKAWESDWNPGGKPAAVAALTDNPATFGPLIDNADTTLYMQTVTVTPQGNPDCSGGNCTQQLAVAAQVRGIGPLSWTSTAAAHQVNGTWKIKADPATIHPKYTANAIFVRRRTLPVRADITDSAGKPLTSQVTVVQVGLDPAKVTNATYAALSRTLQVDPAAAKSAVAQAKTAGQTASVITVRKTDWAKAAGALSGVPGIVTTQDTEPLGLTPTFARAVLGTVKPATPALLQNAGLLATSKDSVGASGLQYAFQKQLAGTPGATVEIRDKSTRTLLATLQTTQPKAGSPVQTSLNLKTQQAAEAAVNSTKAAAHLVAIQASTGRILAVANGPGLQSYNTSFLGGYAPGSTFKTITATALMLGGMTPNSTLPCTSSVSVAGKTFHNEDGLAAYGSGTMTRAMQVSCNTAFISQHGKVSMAALTKAAGLLGFGQKFALGLPSLDGHLPTSSAEAEKAAALIGQGQVLASPLQMATVAAAIDSGQARKPVLVLGHDPSGPAGAAIPAPIDAGLKTMLRAVVTGGTATVLSPAGTVYAKTGTAQVMTGGKLTTNGWMIGFRGDVAFACEVDGGTTGAGSAGPVLLKFLNAL